MQLAMIGLGRMGGNMVRRLLQGGHELIVYDRSADAVKALVVKGVKGAKDLADVAQQLAPRRVVWVMVPAGAPVESTIEQLVPHLARGDIVIEGGNSNFRDSLRRAEALKAQGIEFVDAASGGDQQMESSLAQRSERWLTNGCSRLPSPPLPLGGTSD